MTAIAEAGLVIDAAAPGNIVRVPTDLPVRTLMVHNKDTANNLQVTLRNYHPGKVNVQDRWVLLPGQWKRLFETETSFYDAPGLWCTKEIVFTAATAGQTIANFDFDLTTWDKDNLGGKRYQ